MTPAAFPVWTVGRRGPGMRYPIVPCSADAALEGLATVFPVETLGELAVRGGKALVAGTAGTRSVGLAKLSAAISGVIEEFERTRKEIPPKRPDRPGRLATAGSLLFLARCLIDNEASDDAATAGRNVPGALRPDFDALAAAVAPSLTVTALDVVHLSIALGFENPLRWSTQSPKVREDLAREELARRRRKWEQRLRRARKGK